MAMRLFLVYALVEMAVIVALAWTIGFGWTVLLLAATFVAGVALAGSQARRQVLRLHSTLSATGTQGAVTDSVLVALGSVLVVIPGLATSALGALLLLPPTRAAARPLAAALAARSIGRLPLITMPNDGATRYASGRGDYIDAEVIDAEVIDAEVIDGEVIDGDVEPTAVERKPE